MTTADEGPKPFPEVQLAVLARWLDAGEAVHSAARCRDALDAHAALRDRCLQAELELSQVHRRVREALRTLDRENDELGSVYIDDLTHAILAALEPPSEHPQEEKA